MQRFRVYRSYFFLIVDVDESCLRDGIGREVIKWIGCPVARVHRSYMRVFH